MPEHFGVALGDKELRMVEGGRFLFDPWVGKSREEIG
jgi:hypothetical protein